jgi:hypothetical protein
MQEKTLFEYAVIRIVPRVEREEFLNAGVILYCKHKQFLQCRFIIDPQKLAAFREGLDIVEVHAHLCAFEQICLGNAEGGPIGRLDPGTRFRWLTASRSTVVQTSRVHPGFCTEPAETLEKLFVQLVM